jgi:CheY-like chemotaxis protein
VSTVHQVLVVDDNADIRMLLRAVLEQSGHGVLEAGDGAEALARLRDENEVDGVVLDVQMPDMDGWEILRRIRSDDALTGVAVILCTVKSRLEDTRRGWELGCDGFVNKPFSVAEVADEVTAVLERGPGERRWRREEALVSLPGAEES